MSEKLFPRGEDDRGMSQPYGVDGQENDLTGEHSGQSTSPSESSLPGDPSLEEMMRRAHYSGMDNMPQPSEPFIPMRFNE